MLSLCGRNDNRDGVEVSNPGNRQPGEVETMIF
jgi:hypothetical protein